MKFRILWCSFQMRLKIFLVQLLGDSIRNLQPRVQILFLVCSNLLFMNLSPAPPHPPPPALFFPIFYFLGS